MRYETMVVSVINLGLLGLVAARRRRRGRTGIAALAAVLATLGTQGCCDPTVATTTSSMGESSTTSESGTTDSTSSTGEPALPEWAIGVFSSESDQVGMSFSGNPYWWGNVEITLEGEVFLDVYGCSALIERQEFRWTLTDDVRKLNVQTVPPSDVFTWGNGNEVSEVVIERSDSCDVFLIRYHHVDPMAWSTSEMMRGNVCAKATGSDGCTFTFEWCDGSPPAPCE